VFGGRSRRARAQATREFAETLLHISKYHWHADAEHRRRKIVAKLIEGGKYFSFTTERTPADSAGGTRDWNIASPAYRGRTLGT